MTQMVPATIGLNYQYNVVLIRSESPEKRAMNMRISLNDEANDGWELVEMVLEICYPPSDDELYLATLTYRRPKK